MSRWFEGGSRERERNPGIDTAPEAEHNAVCRKCSIGVTALLPLPSMPSRVLLVIDDRAVGELFARRLMAEGHEVRWAHDTVEARWVWMRNYFQSVIVCAQGATGFVRHIRKEAPTQSIAVVTADELLAATKKPVASVSSISDRSLNKKRSKVLEMPRRRSVRP